MVPLPICLGTLRVAERKKGNRGRRSAQSGEECGVFPPQLLDCKTSRRQIQPELMVERVLVRDRLGDIEQQTRGRSELQLEILVSFVRSEGGHGAGFPPR